MDGNTYPTYPFSHTIQFIPSPTDQQTHLLFESAMDAEGGLLKQLLWLMFKFVLKDRFYRKALHLYEETLSLDPECPKVHSAYGVLLARLGRLSEALGRFQKADELFPANPWIEANLARCHYKLGDMQNADRYYKRAQIDNDALKDT